MLLSNKGIRQSLISNGGFTLMEVMVAMMILALSLTAILELFSDGMRAGSVSQKYLGAVYYAQEQMEEALLETDQPPEKRTEKKNGDYSALIILEPFVPEGVVSSTSERMLYTVTVEVSWGEFSGRKYVILQALRAGEVVEEDGFLQE